MALGPLDFVVLDFPGNQFKGEILPELNAIRASGVVRLVDLIFILKDQQGHITITEASDLKGEDAQRYRQLTGDLSGLLTREDIEAAANDIPPNSSAAFILFEHTWAVGLRDAIRRAGGSVLTHERVDPQVVDMVSDDLAAPAHIDG
ncbi:MAG TPA: DUF6325 family protein [Ktedonobacterales bacterium]